MNIVTSFFTTFISFALMTGVFMHDAQIDNALKSLIDSKVRSSSPTEVKPTDPHIHPAGPGKALIKGFTRQDPNPNYPPRNERRVKKHVLQNHEPKGRHAFDRHYLPVIG